MEIDKITLNDLSIFNAEEEFSIFHKVDFTRTIGGREKLKQNFSKSQNTIEAIIGIQQTLKVIQQNKNAWPQIISNGSIMVIQKFYETSVDQIPSNPSATTAYAYKLFHAPDFSLVKYSTGYGFDFIKGMQLLITALLKDESPNPLKKLLQRAQTIIDKDQFAIFSKKVKADELSMMEFGPHWFRKTFV